MFILASDKTSVRVVSEEVTTDWDLLTKSARYTFHMTVPDQFTKDKDSKCTFFVQVTGGSFGEHASEFDIQLFLENQHEDQQICPDLSAKRMNLVLELKPPFYSSTKWTALGISLFGRPTFEENGNEPYVRMCNGDGTLLLRISLAR